MKTKLTLLALLMLGALSWSAGGAAAQEKEKEKEKEKESKVDVELARQAYFLLKTRCYQCHSTDESTGFDAFDREQVLEHINPTDPRKSKLFELLYTEAMPQTKDKLNLKELRLIEKWIAAGAPFPKITQREPIGELELCIEIEKDLEQLRRDGRKREDLRNQRYFSIANLYNNPVISSFELQLYRAGLSKLLNSLNRRRISKVIVPVAVDKRQTLFRIDLRDYGWTAAEWFNSVLKKYPYTVEYKDNRVSDSHARIQEKFTRVAQNPIPYLRADWFVAKASLPKLYYSLLGLPETVEELEKQLGVEVNASLKSGRDVARAGFYESGVSVNNRLVERHETADGAYWKSYDFARSTGKKNLFLRPLGPNFDGNDFFNDFGFEHDGGEMIFSLPNGLQAYFLSDPTGKRINEGPVAVVRDAAESAGSPIVVNGISCMACHDRGMRRFKDAIRVGFQSGNRNANDKVKELYKPAEDMNELLDGDERRFRDAVFKATRDFLGISDPNEVFKFPEPIAQLVKRYNADLTLEDAAFELGIPARELATHIKGDLNQFLGSLNKGRSVKREFWESKIVDVTAFQEAALESGVAIEATPPEEDGDEKSKEDEKKEDEKKEEKKDDAKKEKEDDAKKDEKEQAKKEE